MASKDGVRNYEDVALAITKRLLQHEAKVSNVVFSPLSVHVVLSLIAAGSKGSSLDQLLSFLRSKSTHDLSLFARDIATKVFADGSPNDGPSLAFGNGIWLDQLFSFNPCFKHVVDTYYKARVSQPDFQTQVVEVVAEVNSWVEKLTRGLITDVLSPGSLNGNTKLILANALYFKGTWVDKFDVSKTKKDNFYLYNGSLVKVPFMNNNYTHQYIAEYDGFKVLSLRYEHGSDERRFSMNFFLPNTKDGLPSLIQKLDSESEFIARHIPHVQRHLNKFKIPKFKISYGIIVSNVLKALGLVLPFSRGSASLLEMVEDSLLAKDVYVSKIIQKAFIEIDEQGTKAAAVTIAVVPLMYPSLPVKYIDFVADHPFLYVIKEDTTETLLFIGQVLNPQAIE